MFLRGTATHEGPTAPRGPAAEGDALPVGTTVCTGPESFSTIRLSVDVAALDHDDVHLGPETCLTLTALGATPVGRTSAVRVGKGRVVVRAAERPGDIVVESNAGVTTGDRGGFRVAIEPDGAARTEALYGAVAVIGSGVERPLRAGQGSRTRIGSPPSLPIDLLPPGSPLRPEVGATLRRAEFSWTPIDEALGYRVELSINADFSEVVYASESPRPGLAPEGLYLPGRVPGLWWRVTSFDLTGFEGPPSDARPVALPDVLGP